MGMEMEKEKGGRGNPVNSNYMFLLGMDKQGCVELYVKSRVMYYFIIFS